MATCLSLQSARLPCQRQAFLAHAPSRTGLQLPQRPHRRNGPPTWARGSAAPGSEPETQATAPGAELELDPDSEIAQKRAEAERLRAAEKFMVLGSGEASCKGCGYEYRPERGDPDFPVPKGVAFQDLPSDYICPVCGAPKLQFESRMRVVAGFAENQKYGLGANSMTGDQKLLLIYGTLALFVILFLGGYALE